MNTKTAIRNEVHQAVVRARVIWNVPGLAFPEIKFTKRGRSAGTCSCVRTGANSHFTNTTCVINFNLPMAKENGQKFIDRTPLHEVAHYINFFIFEGRGHSRSWANIMQRLGAIDCSRCHDYKIVDRNIYVKYPYKCSCETLHQLTAIRHNRTQRNKATYVCRRCNSDLVLAE
jgi:predicted SprT family Zn-dependent metalloprotease